MNTQKGLTEKLSALNIGIAESKENKLSIF